MKKTEKAVLFDLVCGMEIGEFMSEPLKYTFNRKVYYFCSETCKKHFMDDPKKYLM